MKNESLFILGVVLLFYATLFTPVELPKVYAKPAEEYVKRIPDYLDAIVIYPRGDFVYVTSAEFDIMTSYVEAVAGNDSFDRQYQIAQVIINRTVSKDYPSTIDQVIYKKDDSGLWRYLPSGIKLEDISPSDSVCEAVMEALCNPDNLEVVDFFER